MSTVFEKCVSIKRVIIPNTTTSIAGECFLGCTSLTTVNYTGSQEQWNAITVEGDDLINAKIIYNYGK